MHTYMIAIGCFVFLKYIIPNCLKRGQILGEGEFFYPMNKDKT